MSLCKPPWPTVAKAWPATVGEDVGLTVAPWPLPEGEGHGHGHTPRPQSTPLLHLDRGQPRSAARCVP